MDSKFLYFVSDNEAQLIRAPIENGRALIDDKAFIIDETRPIMLRGRFGGVETLYMVKWDASAPAQNVHLPIRDAQITPKFDRGKYEITPTMIRRLMGLEILGNMIKVKKKSPMESFVFMLV